MFRTISFLIIFFSLVFFFSCRRYVSVYQLRHATLTAADSVAWYDSVFNDEIYILDTLLNGKFEHGSFNGNMIVAYKGHVFYEKSLGFKNIFLKDSLTIDNQFQVASVSKPFTSAAILQLVEKGKLSLNDTIEKFFPDFPYKKITVRMLLTHRSGLPDYVKFTDKFFRNGHPETITNDSVIKIMMALKPRALSKPNEKHDYSNTGFLLLASIVEKVSGKNFKEYVKENIFLPCKMKNTFIYDSDSIKKSPMVVSAFEDDAEVSDHYHNGVVGDKGVYTTVHDLLLFDKALKKGEIVTKQWQDSAYTRQNLDWEGPYNYGYGWRLRVGPKGEKIVYHSGWWKGFRSLFIRDLTREITFIVFDNHRNKKFFFVEDYLWIFDKEKEVIFF